MASKAKVDDVYKDDFSSDEEEKTATGGLGQQAITAKSIGWIEAAELVFENSIRDNF